MELKSIFSSVRRILPMLQKENNNFKNRMMIWLSSAKPWKLIYHYFINRLFVGDDIYPQKPKYYKNK